MASSDEPPILDFLPPPLPEALAGLDFHFYCFRVYSQHTYLPRICHGQPEEAWSLVMEFTVLHVRRDIRYV